MILGGTCTSHDFGQLPLCHLTIWGSTVSRGPDAKTLKQQLLVDLPGGLEWWVSVETTKALGLNVF